MNIYPTSFTAGDRTPFTYYLEHKLTKRKYYGRRTRKGCKPEDLWVTYFSSSRLINQIIKEEGADIFAVKVARIFQSADDCILHEQKFLKKVNAAKNPAWFNQHNGGNKFSTTGIPISKEARQKKSKYMSNKRWVSNDIVEFLISKDQLGDYLNHNFRFGRLPQTDTTKMKISKSSRGRIVSAETRQKQSMSLKGKKRPVTPEQCVQRSLARMGKKFSKERCENISKSKLGHIVSGETRNKISKSRKQLFASKPTSTINTR